MSLVRDLPPEEADAIIRLLNRTRNPTVMRRAQVVSSTALLNPMETHIRSIRELALPGTDFRE